MSSNALCFWLIATAMTGLALAFVLPRLLTLRAPASRIRRAALNAAIYRAELASLAGERADGQVSDAQYALAREELERRLLRDVAADVPEPATPAPSRRAAWAIAVALPLAAFGVYARFGDPAAVTMTPVAMQAAAGGDTPASGSRADLVRHLASHPRDGRAWVLLARMDLEADRYEAAADEYRKALDASPKVAADPGIWCEYADALGMAQGGTLAGRPRELVLRALALDAAHPRALEMAGSAAFEQREFATAVRHWQALLAQMPERSRQHQELAAAIVRAGQLAVVAGGTAQAVR
jgi:cytochrome c-type biogenesis protein CcmH